MKKRICCLICAAALLVVLFVPFHVSRYDDGGSVKVTALTYSVVKWKRHEIHWNEDGTSYGGFYENTCVYLFPNNFKNLSDLWEIRH
jgi:hypothetical protein